MEFFEALFTIEGLISLLTLASLEVVLGIDNIVFISIVAGKLPEDQQPKARFVGLALALIARVILLFLISWIIALENPLFTAFNTEISVRDLILFAGGLFLLAKSTTEIHSRVTGVSEEDVVGKKSMTFSKAILQIVLLDMVFSFDSILTAVGLVEHISIMVVAVIIAMVFMLIFAETVSNFVNENPTIKMLALSFLLMIGLLLIVEAVHVHVPRGYVYFAMGFSLFVEILNLRMMKTKKAKKKSS